MNGINSNLSSMYSALEKLASGRRINRASDGPATLVISQQLQSQIASLTQEIENVSANIGKSETASATMTGLRDQLTEIRAMAVGAANGAVNSDEAQQAYAIAADSLTATFNATVRNASYNGKHLLDGSEGSLAEVAELVEMDLSSPEAAAATIERIDAAARDLDQAMVQVGAAQKNDLESRWKSLQITKQNLVAAESALTDTDYALEVSKYVGSLIRSQTAVALLSHSLMKAPSVVSLLNP